MATHTVGAALLRGEWKAAANLILQPRDGDILHSFIQKMKIVLLEDGGSTCHFGFLLYRLDLVLAFMA